MSMEDRRLHKTIDRWKVIVGAAIAFMGMVWLVVTRADDLIRKADRVPAIEEAVLQLKVNEELAQARMQRMEQRQALIEEQSNRNSAAILYRLDQLLEKDHDR